jgi:hypothetical protein
MAGFELFKRQGEICGVRSDEMERFVFESEFQ